jgi:hypothetical protein
MRVLLILILGLFGCAGGPPGEIASFPSIEILVDLPEADVETMNALIELGSERLEELAVSYQDVEIKEPDYYRERHIFECLVIRMDDGYITNRELEGLNHQKFRLIGSIETWIPIDGKPRKYLIMRMDK